MSDNFMANFALGYLAAGSTTQFANQGAAIITRALRPAPPTIDVGVLVAEIARLREQNTFLESEVERLASYALELRTWGRGLYDELEKLKAS